MSECKPTNTPGYGPELFDQQLDETPLDEEETERYQDIVGCLIYVSQVLRYEIVYAVGQLARPMAKPSKIHMVAAKHTLCYLAGTTDLSTTYKRGGFKLGSLFGLQLGQQPGQRKVHLILLVDDVRCAGWLQVGATRSDCHVDNGGGAGRVVIGDEGSSLCSNMLTELVFGKDFVIVLLYCDNTAMLHVLGNRPFSSRTEHIALRFFFIRELVSEGRISIHYIPTDINPGHLWEADVV